MTTRGRPRTAKLDTKWDASAFRGALSASGMTVEQLCAEVQVRLGDDALTIATLQRWLKGQNDAKGRQMIEIADILGVHGRNLYVK